MSFSLHLLSHLSSVDHWECLAYLRYSANYQLCTFAVNSGDPSWVSKMDLSISFSNIFYYDEFINTKYFCFQAPSRSCCWVWWGQNSSIIQLSAIIRINIRVRKWAIQRQIVFKNNLNTWNGFILLKLFVKCYCDNYSNIHSDMYILIVINSSTPSSWHKVDRALLLN